MFLIYTPLSGVCPDCCVVLCRFCLQCTRRFILPCLESVQTVVLCCVVSGSSVPVALYSLVWSLSRLLCCVVSGSSVPVALDLAATGTGFHIQVHVRNVFLLVA